MTDSNLDRRASELPELSPGSVALGLGLTIMFHVIVQVPTFFLLIAIASGEWSLELPIRAVTYIGLTQLVYMIPAVLFSRHRGESETAKGLIIGASITFLLNAACSGLLFWNR
jgi:hypothetical protein